MQLLRPPPRRQQTPSPQHPGSEETTTPSIQYAAVHVPHPTCAPQWIGWISQSTHPQSQEDLPFRILQVLACCWQTEDAKKAESNKGKKSPANKGASLESLYILLESVKDTMIVKYMHKYAIYAFLSKICQDLRANLAINQCINVSSSLDRDFRVNILKRWPNNISPHVVKPPTVQWLDLSEKVSAAVAVWR